MCWVNAFEILNVPSCDAATQKLIQKYWTQKYRAENVYDNYFAENYCLTIKIKNTNTNEITF